jgi:hypothetical protein
MTRKSWGLERIRALAPVLLWALLYGSRLAKTVQTGDTGELVTASGLLTVAHPPGYPLYIWLFHLGQWLLPWGTPFWQASLLNSLCALGTLFFFFFLHPAYRILLTLAGVSVAVAPVFWKYSILPDVFGLHWLLMLGALWIFFHPRFRNESRRLLFLSGILGLSFSHHLTVMFLAPLWIDQAARVKKTRPIFLSLLCGGVITAVLYCSIFALDRNHWLSWGQIENFSDLFRHFLRADYGSWGLSASHQSGFLSADLVLFGKSLLRDFFTLILSVGLLLFWRGNVRVRRKTSLDLQRRRNAVGLSLLLYVAGFFPWCNVGPFGFGYEVFERFLGMPLLLGAVFLALQFSDDEILAILKRVTGPSPRLRRGGAVVLLFLAFVPSFWTRRKVFDYSKRKKIEEYARNLLREKAPHSDRPTLVTAFSDSSLHALYYLTALRGEGAGQIYPISPIGLDIPWVRRKMKAHFPNLKFSDTPGRPYLFSDLVRDNSESFNFLAEQLVNGPQLSTLYVASGRFLESGSGIHFRPRAESNLTIASWKKISPNRYQDYDPDLEAHSRYAFYFLAQGMEAYQKGDLAQATDHFYEGLEWVPYCQPCLANLCRILAQQKKMPEVAACNVGLDRLFQDYYNYFGAPQ